MQHAVLGVKRVEHVGVVFQAELEKLHDGVNRKVVFTPFATYRLRIFDVVLLPGIKALDLAVEARDLASQVREDHTSLGGMHKCMSDIGRFV